MSNIPPEQTRTIAPPTLAEPNLFWIRGRIGVGSMLFRWLVCVGITVVAARVLVRDTPGSVGAALYACICYLAAGFFLINAIKRGHDMGYSAWGVIILLFLPILLLLPGDKQSNDYGPPPSRRW